MAKRKRKTDPPKYERLMGTTDTTKVKRVVPPNLMDTYEDQQKRKGVKKVTPQSMKKKRGGKRNKDINASYKDFLSL